MQEKYRLYRRSNRAQGTFYAENRDTGAQESLGTKSTVEALRLLQAKNEAASQPAFNREMATLRNIKLVDTTADDMLAVLG